MVATQALVRNCSASGGTVAQVVKDRQLRFSSADARDRVLALRGSVTSVKAKDTRIMVEFEINPRWDLTESEKVKYLEEWISAKVKVVFKVHKVSTTFKQAHKKERQRKELRRFSW